MNSCRRIITAFALAIVFVPSVYSDILPLSEVDDRRIHSINAFSSKTVLQKTQFSRSNSPFIADLDLCSFDFSFDFNADAVKHTPEIQPSITLTDGHSSLNLCLSALLSLGLCSSVHWVRKIHFGIIPEWYHNGGPFQIGHSHALMPGTLSPAPACCFIQPSCAEDKHLPQYFIKTVISLWRESQFTPIVLASRGPPNMS